ncbi:MAG: hypothetical protein ACYTF1_19805 [Planctomycetota bacterium]|jgi:hypothetical protein
MFLEWLEEYQVVPFALALIAVIFLLSSLWRRQRKRRREKDRPTSVGRPQGSSSDTHLRRDLESLIVELQELSRRISAEIDTRFAKLEAAIRDADSRIAVLNRLNRQLGDKTTDAGEPVEDHNSRNAAIYDLADAGLTPVQIARDLGKTPGEVELILNLRPQRES